LQIDVEGLDKLDLHIHLPEGAIPKDGPSAGITMGVALISAITNRPVRSDIAMTGEITLTGRVLAIGGLKEKALAAHRSGMKYVVAPSSNKPDWTDLPRAVRTEMEFVWVETMDQVIAMALRESQLSTAVPTVPQVDPSNQDADADIQSDTDPAAGTTGRRKNQGHVPSPSPSVQTQHSAKAAQKKPK
jgi:ATP-dependent Lon protease